MLDKLFELLVISDSKCSIFIIKICLGLTLYDSIDRFHMSINLFMCFVIVGIFVTTCSVLARLLIKTLLTNYTNVYICKASLAYSDIRIISKR